jgi:hypothetical protein
MRSFDMIAWIFVLVLTSGCFSGVSDKEWEKTVPGIYEGKEADLHETLVLERSGGFDHRVMVGTNVVLVEKGMWRYEVSNGILSLEPFTSFYDDVTTKLRTNGIRRDVGSLGVLRYGKAASKISFSPDTHYCLNKKG